MVQEQPSPDHQPADVAGFVLPTVAATTKDDRMTTEERPEDLLEQTRAAAIRDRQTVADGEQLVPLLHGMSIRRTRTHTDDRGTLTEMLDPRWPDYPDPIVYAFMRDMTIATT